MGTVGLVGVLDLDLGAAGGLDDEEDDDDDDDEAAGADFLAAAASASRELVRGAVGGLMRTLWALGGMFGGGDDGLCGLIFLWMEGESERVCVSSRGRDGGRCLWVRYYYLLLRTKDLWSSYQNRRMRRYVRNERTLSLSYLPLYLKGLMDVKPCVHNCDRVKFMNGMVH